MAAPLKLEAYQQTRWCFTSFRTDWEENWNTVGKMLASTLGVGYIIYGKETCPETGKKHIQGYVEFAKKKTMKGAQQAIGDPNAHMEGARGTGEQASDYCKKEGDWVEMGKKKKQGDRTDLTLVRDLVRTGGMRAVLTDDRNFNYQACRMAQLYMTFLEPERDFKPQVISLWGPSGVGKSRDARLILAGFDIYCKNTFHKWFDGYDGHEAIILDDFRDSWMTLTDLLSFIDRYGRQAECKGGNRQLRAKYIVITSIRPPSEWYSNAVGEPREQILRRFDEIIEMKL